MEGREGEEGWGTRGKSEGMLLEVGSRQAASALRQSGGKSSLLLEARRGRERLKRTFLERIGRQRLDRKRAVVDSDVSTLQLC